MSTLKNKVQLIGYVGNQPETSTFENGRKLSRFSLATNETYYNSNGEKVQQTEWHNLIAWGKQADLVEKYLTKGKEIAIDGKLSSRSYENKEGEKKVITEVIIREILFMGNHDSNS